MMASKRGARIFWILLLVAHAPAVVAACAALISGETGVANAIWRIASLSAACSLFILKICDVAWLRWHVGRRSLVGITIVVALLHADALRRAIVTDSTTDAGVWQVAMLAGGASLIAPALQRRLERPVDCSTPTRPALQITRRAVDLIPKLQFEKLLASCRVNRAPPVCAL